MRWTHISFELDAETFGSLLETPDGLYAYNVEGVPRVPAFPSREDAEHFVRDLDRDASFEDAGGDYALMQFVAFASGAGELPPDAEDAFTFLSELALAAGRSFDAQLDALERNPERARPLAAQLVRLARGVLVRLG